MSYRSIFLAAGLSLLLPTGVLAAPSAPLDTEVEPEALPGHLDAMVMVQVARPLINQPTTFNGMLQLDGGFELPHVEFFVMPRLRIDDLRAPRATSALFLQQGYGTLHLDIVRLKVGKILNQFGRIWDYGLYGPLLAATDVKMTPDFGLSLETSLSLPQSWQLFWAGQFFFLDGKAFAYRNDRFFSYDNARRRNIGTLRVQPSVAVGDGRLSFAVNGQHFQSVRLQMGHVWRLAADVDYTRDGFDAFAEIGEQWGKDLVSDDEQIIGRHSYLWAGLQKRIGPVLLRHHLNLVYYRREGRWLDILHQPGAEWQLTDKFSLIAEAALWHNLPDQTGRGEYSFFLVGMGHT